VTDSQRPKLLVSVRDVSEAQAALAGGADWIDLKQPARGALGAVDAAAAREVVDFVGDRAVVSAAGGELLDWCDGASRQLQDVDRLSMVKLGLAGCIDATWQSRWRDAARELEAAGKSLAAVVYADHQRARAPLPSLVVELACAAPCRWILFDTYDKANGALLDHLPRQALEPLLDTARRRGRRIAVAGSLALHSIASLPLELIDVIAVRGAACSGGRDGVVSSDRVLRLKAELSRDCSWTTPAAVT